MPAIATDTYGDGLIDGNGLSLSYDSATVLSIDLYDTGTLGEDGASYWVAEMGVCGGSGNDDGSDQTGSGDDDDDKDQGTDNGDDGQGGSDNDDEDEDNNGSGGTGGSCYDTVMTLTTDSYAEEMAVVMYDTNDVDANGDPAAIFVSDFGSLENNSNYVVEDLCLDNSGCYVFALVDAGGDGFLSTGGLEMTVDGETVLSVGPGDLGTYDSEIGGMYWVASFGNCDV
jgi:hypothetical protein